MGVLKILGLFLILLIGQEEKLVRCQAEEILKFNSSLTKPPKLAADKELTHVRTKNLSGNVKLTTLQVLPTNTPLDNLNNEFDNEEEDIFEATSAPPLSKNKQDENQTIPENQQKVSLLSELGTKAPTDGMESFSLMDVFNGTSGTLPDQPATEKLITVTPPNFELISEEVTSTIVSFTEKFVAGSDFGGGVSDDEEEIFGANSTQTADSEKSEGMGTEVPFIDAVSTVMTTDNPTVSPKLGNNGESRERNLELEEIETSTSTQLMTAHMYQSERVNSFDDDAFTVSSEGSVSTTVTENNASDRTINSLWEGKHLVNETEEADKRTKLMKLSLTLNSENFEESREDIEDVSSFINIDEEFLKNAASVSREGLSMYDAIEDVSLLLSKDVESTTLSTLERNLENFDDEMMTEKNEISSVEMTENFSSKISGESSTFGTTYGLTKTFVENSEKFLETTVSEINNVSQDTTEYTPVSNELREVDVTTENFEMINYWATISKEEKIDGFNFEDYMPQTTTEYSPNTMNEEIMISNTEKLIDQNNIVSNLKEVSTTDEENLIVDYSTANNILREELTTRQNSTTEILKIEDAEDVSTLATTAEYLFTSKELNQKTTTTSLQDLPRFNEITTLSSEKGEETLLEDFEQITTLIVDSATTDNVLREEVTTRQNSTTKILKIEETEDILTSATTAEYLFTSKELNQKTTTSLQDLPRFNEITTLSSEKSEETLLEDFEQITTLIEDSATTDNILREKLTRQNSDLSAPEILKIKDTEDVSTLATTAQYLFTNNELEQTTTNSLQGLSHFKEITTLSSEEPEETILENFEQITKEDNLKFTIAEENSFISDSLDEEKVTTSSFQQFTTEIEEENNKSKFNSSMTDNQLTTENIFISTLVTASTEIYNQSKEEITTNNLQSLLTLDYFTTTSTEEFTENLNVTTKKNLNEAKSEDNLMEATSREYEQLSEEDLSNSQEFTTSEQMSAESNGEISSNTTENIEDITEVEVKITHSGDQPFEFEENSTKVSSSNDENFVNFQNSTENFEMVTEVEVKTTDNGDHERFEFEENATRVSSPSRNNEFEGEVTTNNIKKITDKKISTESNDESFITFPITTEDMEDMTEVEIRTTDNGDHQRFEFEENTTKISSPSRKNESEEVTTNNIDRITDKKLSTEFNDESFINFPNTTENIEDVTKVEIRTTDNGDHQRFEFEENTTKVSSPSRNNELEKEVATNNIDRITDRKFPTESNDESFINFPSTTENIEDVTEIEVKTTNINHQRFEFEESTTTVSSEDHNNELQEEITTNNIEKFMDINHSTKTNGEETLEETTENFLQLEKTTIRSPTFQEKEFISIEEFNTLVTTEKDDISTEEISTTTNNVENITLNLKSTQRQGKKDSNIDMTTELSTIDETDIRTNFETTTLIFIEEKLEKAAIKLVSMGIKNFISTLIGSTKSDSFPSNEDTVFKEIELKPEEDENYLSTTEIYEFKETDFGNDNDVGSNEDKSDDTSEDSDEKYEKLRPWAVENDIKELSSEEEETPTEKHAKEFSTTVPTSTEYVLTELSVFSDKLFVRKSIHKNSVQMNKEQPKIIPTNTSHIMKIPKISDSLVNFFHPKNNDLALKTLHSTSDITTEEEDPQISVKLDEKTLHFSIRITDNQTSFFIPSDAFITVPSPNTVNITWKSSTPSMNNSLELNLGNSLQLSVVKDAEMHIYNALISESRNKLDGDKHLIALDDGIQIYFSNTEVLMGQENQPFTADAASKQVEVLAAEIVGGCIGIFVIVSILVYCSIKKFKAKTRNFKPNDSV